MLSILLNKNQCEFYFFIYCNSNYFKDEKVNDSIINVYLFFFSGF